MDNPLLTIFLIEDEGLLSRMYSRKLELDGFQVLVAANGQEGIDILANTSVDLIICDMMMPVLDGLETLKIIKNKHDSKNIPVIMLSNLSEEAYVSKAIELGAVDYLVKNKLLPADVVIKVKKVLATYVIPTVRNDQ